MRLYLLLIIVVAICLSSQLAVGQTTPVVNSASDLKQKLEQIGVGNAATVKRKDGLVFSGVISKLTDSSATIADKSLNVNIEIAYTEMTDVVSGAASGKTWNGKAKVSHSRRNFVLVMLAAGILIPVIIAASRNSSHGPVFTPAP